MNKYLIIFLMFASGIAGQTWDSENHKLFSPDNLDGTYNNPIIFADYSDPDVIRVEDDFYMVSSSFSHFPGLPVLHSKDLLNWKIIGHAATSYPFKEFNKPQHGNGIWAPSLRYHDGYFWIFFGDPDHGILMTKAKDPAGPWQPLHLLEEARGWIDPCPFWDDDGQAYLVRAWAKSRSGIKSILTLHRMSADGKELLDEGLLIFDGQENHPTMEGPKLYKRNGYYYIFAPAGGVKPGWQTVLRSKNIYGPYEDKIVLEQGSTNINGPHQGALVVLESGESWFVHFQDRFAYGRVVHLNPVKWVSDWPVIGIDLDGNGIGEPVHICNKPDIGKIYNPNNPQTSDEFETNNLELQWQWEALPQKNWYSLEDKKGSLRLFCVNKPDEFKSLRDLPNIIGQKLPANDFRVEIKLTANIKDSSDTAGLVILGSDYSVVQINRNNKNLQLIRKSYFDKDKKEKLGEKITLKQNTVYLKVHVYEDAVCSFAYSEDGKNFRIFGKEFYAAAGRWVGAKIGLFAVSDKSSSKSYIDVDYIRFSK